MLAPIVIAEEVAVYIWSTLLESGFEPTIGPKGVLSKAKLNVAPEQAGNYYQV